MINNDELLHVLDEVTEQIATVWRNSHDGGWAAEPPESGPNRLSDVWSTAEMVLWLDQYDRSRYHGQISDGLEYLASCQHIEDNFVDGEIDGGWGSQLDRDSEPTGTTLALLAFVRTSNHVIPNSTPQGEYPYIKNMKLARNWLITHVNPDGGWSLLAQPHSSAFNTCWASIALQECLSIPELDDNRIKAAILPNSLTLVETSGRNGGWGNTLSQRADAIGTAYCTYLLLYMGRNIAANRGIGWLVQSQSNDGSWEPGPIQSPVEATARAVLALCSSSSARNQARVAAAIGSGINYLMSLYKPGSGWPEQPNGPARVWTTYYTCRALLSYIDAIREDQGSGGLPLSRKRKRVFIVHGHHPSLRSNVKAIVQKLSLEPVVLEEMPNLGAATIMEKFEHYAKQEGVDYALVLLTPDDMIVSHNAMAPRENALIELGWFIAKLGRQRVCLLWDPAVKLPTDLDGVMRIDIREEDWEREFEKELRSLIQTQDTQDKDQE